MAAIKSLFEPTVREIEARQSRTTPLPPRTPLCRGTLVTRQMPRSLEIEGYYSDTQEQKDASHLVSVPSATEKPEYSEAARRGALRLFADRGPRREDRLNDAAVDALEKRPAAEKRALCRTVTRRLSETLDDRYGFDAEPTDSERVFEHVSTDPIPYSFTTFPLRSVRRSSRRIHEYRRKLQDGESGESSGVFGAVRRLPDPYLNAKASQYEGDVRVEVVDRLGPRE